MSDGIQVTQLGSVRSGAGAQDYDDNSAESFHDFHRISDPSFFLSALSLYFILNIGIKLIILHCLLCAQNEI